MPANSVPIIADLQHLVHKQLRVHDLNIFIKIGTHGFPCDYFALAQHVIPYLHQPFLYLILQFADAEHLHTFELVSQFAVVFD